MGPRRGQPLCAPPQEPTFTLKDVHSAIPKHLHRQITWKSFAYLLRDLLQVATSAYITHLLIEKVATPINNVFLTYTIWTLYWIIQGFNFTAIWVIAHECGHQAFSPYRAVNDAVGWIFHSALLVPYHSWRITHGNHHKNCSHNDKDTVFVPPKKTEEEVSALEEAVLESPIVTLIQVIMMFTIGWVGYLFFNVASQKYPDHKGRVNHFEPSSPLFRKDEKADILISDLGIVIALAAIGYSIYTFGFANVVFWYGVPYLFCNKWLVTITYLQHTDEKVAHYDAQNWTFLKGALATVDRDYGILNAWFHHITDSHVVHHLFSTMPFYHAIEATKYVKPAVGKHYMSANNGVLSIYASVWSSWRQCRYIVPTDGVAMFRQ